jgi:hypothetical protein
MENVGATRNSRDARHVALVRPERRLDIPWRPMGDLPTAGAAWSFFVIADSAQFSTLVTESVPAHGVGTALTLQTSLGFLLTVLSIQMVPLLVGLAGWRWAFPVLALGPGLGIVAIRQLVALKRSSQLEVDEA